MKVGLILINHEYKLIYLPIFKNGTSETSCILLVYYNFIQVQHEELDNEDPDNEDPNKKDQYYNQVFDMYPNYFIFTCCRNPYFRYNSAIKYLTNIGKSQTDKQDDNLNNIFIDNKLNDKLIIYTKNHLIEQYHYYHKCNYVIRLEAYHEDLIKLLLKFNIPLRHAHLLKNNIKLNNTKKNDNIAFNDELIKNINIFYKKDFEVYNYSIIENTDELNDLFNNIKYEDVNNIYNEYKNYFLDENEINKFIINILTQDNEEEGKVEEEVEDEDKDEDEEED